MGRLALVEIYEEPDWIQIRPSRGSKRLHAAGVYYFLRMKGDVPIATARRAYSITFTDRLMTFVSNCFGPDHTLLPPTRANSKMSGAWDSKIARFLAKHELLSTGRGVERVWLKTRPEVIEFLKKVNSGEIST